MHNFEWKGCSNERKIELCFSNKKKLNYENLKESLSDPNNENVKLNTGIKEITVNNPKYSISNF